MTFFSIITISYNSEKTIEKTIKSVLSQDYNKYEYIIVDGMSTDRTLDIVNKYSKYIEKVICEKDEGISDAFNKGIKAAKGDYILLLNSDDVMIDNVLREVDSYIEEGIDVLHNNINNYFASLVIGGHTMDNIIIYIIYCTLLILVKNVLDIEYIIPL